MINLSRRCLLRITPFYQQNALALSPQKLRRNFGFRNDNENSEEKQNVLNFVEKETDDASTYDIQDKVRGENQSNDSNDQYGENRPDQYGENRPDQYGENEPDQYGENRPDQYDGNRPDQYDGNEPDQYDGNRPDLYDGNEPDLYDGNRPDLYDGNRPDQYDGNELDQYDGDKGRHKEEEEIRKEMRGQNFYDEDYSSEEKEKRMTKKEYIEIIDKLQTNIALMNRMINGLKKKNRYPAVLEEYKTKRSKLKAKNKVNEKEYRQNIAQRLAFILWNKTEFSSKTIRTITGNIIADEEFEKAGFVEDAMKEKIPFSPYTWLSPLKFKVGNPAFKYKYLSRFIPRAVELQNAATLRCRELKKQLSELEETHLELEEWLKTKKRNEIQLDKKKLELEKLLVRKNDFN